jgi:dihydropteroate synthase
MDMSDVMERNRMLRCKGKILDLSQRSYVMGVLNVTPDSFSDGGKYIDGDIALRHALSMIDDGADIIDIGGESTRPKGPYGDGARPVSAQEEMDRVIPVIERLAASTDAIISIDTYKSDVAREALQAGASMVNDISGLLFDPRIAAVAAENKAALVVMHIRGTPSTMQLQPEYDDVVREVKEELQQSAAKATASGVRDIIIDPGIGFGKDLTHNLTIIKHLSAFRDLGFPIMIGTSRKGFIGSLLNLPVDQRLEGNAATVAAALLNGADIIRVHDVKEMKRVAVVIDAIKKIQ